MAGGFVAGPPARVRIKGHSASVARFFFIAVAFFLPWVLITSELGHYSRVYGPQILLELSLMFNLPAIPVLIVTGQVEKFLDEQVGPIPSMLIRLMVGLAGCTACAAAFPFIPPTHVALLWMVAVLGMLSAVAFSTAYQLVQWFRHADIIALGIGGVATGPMVLALQLALEVHPDPSRWQWITMFEITAGVCCLGLASAASLFGQYWKVLTGEEEYVDMRVPLLGEQAAQDQAADDAREACAMNLARAATAQVVLPPDPMAVVLAQGNIWPDEDERGVPYLRRATTLPSSALLDSTHFSFDRTFPGARRGGLSRAHSGASDMRVGSRAPRTASRSTQDLSLVTTIGRSASGSGAYFLGQSSDPDEADAGVAIPIPVGHAGGPEGGGGNHRGMPAAPELSFVPTGIPPVSAPSSATHSPVKGSSRKPAGGGAALGTGGGTGSAGRAGVDAQTASSAALTTLDEAGSTLQTSLSVAPDGKENAGGSRIASPPPRSATPPPMSLRQETVLVMKDAWQVLVAFMVSVTLMYVVFPFFTYVPSSGLMPDISRVLFFGRIFADIVGRFAPRRKALMVHAPEALVTMAVIKVVLSVLFFVYIKAPARFHHDLLSLVIVLLLWLVGGYINTSANIMAPNLVQPQLVGRASALLALIFQVAHFAGLVIAVLLAYVLYGDVIG